MVRQKMPDSFERSSGSSDHSSETLACQRLIQMIEMFLKGLAWNILKACDLKWSIHGMFSTMHTICL